MDGENKKTLELKDALNQVSNTQLSGLKNTLASLQKEGAISLDFDPQEITNIEELEKKLEEIDEQDFAKVKQAVSDFSKTGKEAGGARCWYGRSS